MTFKALPEHMFSVKLNNGKFAFGVITIAPPKHFPWTNIYNVELDSDSNADFEFAKSKPILIYDQILAGVLNNESPTDGWKVSQEEDNSEKSKLLNPYYLLGIPPNITLRRIDEPSFKASVSTDVFNRLRGKVQVLIGRSSDFYMAHIETCLKEQKAVRTDPSIVKSLGIVS